MSVLICKNISTEGPGTIGEFLGEAGIAFRVAELSRGDEIGDADESDTLVLLGGPMSVNEAARYPYLIREEEVVRRFVADGRGVLGICLGAQIIAKVLGARVYKNVHKEVGWHPISLTKDGLRDHRIRSLAVQWDGEDEEISFPAFHWHEETFDLPGGARHLAASELCANQVFRHGDHAYGFQCHMEVTKDMIFDWMSGEDIDRDALRQETERFYEPYRMGAYRFYESFFIGPVSRSRHTGEGRYHATSKVYSNDS